MDAIELDERGTFTKIEGKLHEPAVVNGYILWDVEKGWFQSEVQVMSDRRRAGVVLTPKGALTVAFPLDGAGTLPDNTITQITFWRNINHIMQRLENSTREFEKESGGF